jgi:hypothetical protein
MVRRFFTFSEKKLSNIHVNVHPAGFFHSPFKSVFFMKECHSSLQTEGGMTFLHEKHGFKWGMKKWMDINMNI